jgi:hypothetical protein
LSKRKCQEGAPCRGKKVRRKEELGLPALPDLCGKACRWAELHRRIASTWGRLGRERKREAREESLGYLWVALACKRG